MNFIRKQWKTGAYYGAISWLSVAVLGYGLALRKYGENLGSAPNWAGARRESREGRLSFAEVRPGQPVRFRLESSAEYWVVPREAVPDGAWPLLRQSMVPGVRIALQGDVRSMTALEIRMNPDTPFPKVLISEQAARDLYPQFAAQTAASGQGWVNFGKTLLPIGIIAHLVWAYRFRGRFFMKTVRKASTTGRE